MPFSVAQKLRKQASECLEVAQRTSDGTVRNELLAAAAWLHDEAVRLELLLQKIGSRQRAGCAPHIGRETDAGKRVARSALKEELQHGAKTPGDDHAAIEA